MKKITQIFYGRERTVINLQQLRDDLHQFMAEESANKNEVSTRLKKSSDVMLAAAVARFGPDNYANILTSLNLLSYDTVISDKTAGASTAVGVRMLLMQQALVTFGSVLSLGRAKVLALPDMDALKMTNLEQLFFVNGLAFFEASD